MYLKEFHYILAIAEQGSITKAAEKLYIAQPSLSHALEEYERALGARLFIRSHCGVTPTAFGDKIIVIARKTLQEIDSTAEEFRALAAPSISNLCIGIPDQRGVSLTPYFQYQAANLMPHIRFHVLEDRPVCLREAFQAGNCDLFVSHAPDRKPLFPQDRCSVVCEEEILLAVPPEHLLLRNIRTDRDTGRSFLPVKDLQDRNFYLCSSDRGIRRFSEDFLDQKHIRWQLQGESTNIATALNACVTFGTITFVPEQFARRNRELTYVSVGRAGIFWYMQLISGSRVTPACHEEVCRILKEGYR